VSPACSDRSDRVPRISERGKSRVPGAVPTVPTVPAAKPSPEIIRLFAAAERVVLSPDALADEAELTVRGEPLP
jgi:hypothetical protein